MRKSVNYRHVTLVIGILVALVIALTLWTAAPAEVVSGERSLHSTGFVPSAGDLIEAASRLVFDLE